MATPRKVRTRANRIYEAPGIRASMRLWLVDNAPFLRKSGSRERGTWRGRIERNLNKNTVSAGPRDLLGDKIKLGVSLFPGGRDKGWQGLREKRKSGKSDDENTLDVVIARFSDTRN